MVSETLFLYTAGENGGGCMNFFPSFQVASLINICNLTKCYNIAASWLFSSKKDKGWWESGATSEAVLQVLRPAPGGEPRRNMKASLASNQLPRATSCKRILQPFLKGFISKHRNWDAGSLEWRAESPVGAGSRRTHDCWLGGRNQSASLDNLTLRLHHQLTRHTCNQSHIHTLR